MSKANGLRRATEARIFWCVLACLTSHTAACAPGCPRGATLRGDVCVPNEPIDEGGQTDSDQGGTSGNQRAGMDSSTASATMSSTSAVAGFGNGSNGVAGIASVPPPMAADGTAGTSSSAHSATAAGTTSAPTAPTAGTASAPTAPTAGGSGTQVDMTPPPNAPQSSSAGTGAEPMSTMPSCTPRQEECNGADDDCDQRVDENADLECGNTQNLPLPCKKGIRACRNGRLDDQCQGAVEPKPEVCDAAREDEDCNGVPNQGCDCTEGQSMPCSTSRYTCKQGIAMCTNGKFSGTCQGEEKGSEEVCDGLDNDCDGTRDNGNDALCSAGKHCAGTSGCVECVSDGQCPTTAGGCTLPSCNRSTHRCVPMNASPGTRCTTNGGKLCNASGQCMECIGDSDCPSVSSDGPCRRQSCTNSRCTSAVANVGSACGTAGETCNASGTCVAPAPSGSGACSTDADCGAVSCYTQRGHCTSVCLSHVDCTKTGRFGICYSGGVCSLGCNGPTDCPSGLGCQKLANGPLTVSAVGTFAGMCQKNPTMPVP